MTMKMKMKLKLRSEKLEKDDYLIQISTLVNDGSTEAAELSSEPSGIDFGSLSVPFSVFLIEKAKEADLPHDIDNLISGLVPVDDVHV